jgi:transcriptional regulator with XRE-family HTH domain
MISKLFYLNKKVLDRFFQIDYLEFVVRDDIKHEVRNLHIGRKIRELRKKSGLILQDLSDQTGLSKPLLSQIEKGAVSPPIATLLRISKAFSVNIGFFFQESDPEEKVVLVKRDESKVLDSRYFGREASGYYYEALAFKKSKKNMEPFLVEFKRMRPENLSYFSHEGEEFIYLLDGVLEFRTEKERYVLHPGDSLYFESSLPHAYRALERRNAKALTVIYPVR